MKSMDSIDVSNRKPRRFRGTPSYRLRNIISVAVIAYTLAIGGFFMWAPITRNVRDMFEVFGEARLHDLKEMTSEERYKQRAMLLSYNSKRYQHYPKYEEEVNARSGQ